MNNSLETLHNTYKKYHNQIFETLRPIKRRSVEFTMIKNSFNDFYNNLTESEQREWNIPTLKYAFDKLEKIFSDNIDTEDIDNNLIKIITKYIGYTIDEMLQEEIEAEKE